MNKLLFISFLFSFFIFMSVSLAQPQWYLQNSGGNRELTDVCFVDENNGWISGWTETMLHTTDGGISWTPQNIPPTNAYFSVNFTDVLNGWATGYAGKIVHTTDGGQNWLDQTAPYNTDYYKVFFIDSNTGWIAGGDAGGFPSYISHRVILHTSNGGATWILQYGQAYESLLRSIYFVDQNNGYATGESGIIMKTTDGGNNWTQNVISSFHFYDVFFANTSTGWVIGEYLGVPHYAAIFKTTDGGNSWDETQLGTDESLGGINFSDLMHGYAVGGNASNGGLIYYTSDGGTNWIQQNIPATEYLYRVFFFDGNHGWASGHLGTIISTVNPLPVELTSFTATAENNSVLLNWQTATETNNSGFEIERNQMSEVKNQMEWERIGFIEGHGTTAEETNYSFTDRNLQPGNYSYKLVQIDFDGTRNESDIVNVEVNPQPNEYNLSQNFPNPFNPQTTIKYSIPVGEIVKLSIISLTGEEVKTLVNEFKTEGTYKVTFNAENLPSGIYFYRLVSGNFYSVKKMILLK